MLSLWDLAVPDTFSPTSVTPALADDDFVLWQPLFWKQKLLFSVIPRQKEENAIPDLIKSGWLKRQINTLVNLVKGL